jgi:hypothetical protein
VGENILILSSKIICFQRNDINTFLTGSLRSSVALTVNWGKHFWPSRREQCRKIPAANGC